MGWGEGREDEHAFVGWVHVPWLGGRPTVACGVGNGCVAAGWAAGVRLCVRRARVSGIAASATERQHHESMTANRTHEDDDPGQRGVIMKRV